MPLQSGSSVGQQSGHIKVPSPCPVPSLDVDELEHGITPHEGHQSKNTGYESDDGRQNADPGTTDKQAPSGSLDSLAVDWEKTNLDAPSTPPAPQAKPKPTLDGMPEELLLHLCDIIRNEQEATHQEAFQDREPFHCLAGVNRRLNRIATTYLYAKYAAYYSQYEDEPVTQRRGTKRGFPYIRILAQNPTLAQRVRTADLRYSENRCCKRSGEKDLLWLHQALQLLEQPHVNLADERDAEVLVCRNDDDGRFRSAATIALLPNLERLSISAGSGGLPHIPPWLLVLDLRHDHKFDARHHFQHLKHLSISVAMHDINVQALSGIFALPSLNTFETERVGQCTRPFSWDCASRASSIQHLSFTCSPITHCDFIASAILSCRALSFFEWWGTFMGPSQDRGFRLLLSALSAHATSLETLELPSFLFWEDERVNPIGRNQGQSLGSLSSLESLKSLKISDRFLDAEPEQCLPLSEFMPPNLQLLHICCQNSPLPRVKDAILQFQVVCAHTSSFPYLKSVIVDYDDEYRKDLGLFVQTLKNQKSRPGLEFKVYVNGEPWKEYVSYESVPSRAYLNSVPMLLRIMP